MCDVPPLDVKRYEVEFKLLKQLPRMCYVNATCPDNAKDWVRAHYPLCEIIDVRET